MTAPTVEVLVRPWQVGARVVVLLALLAGAVHAWQQPRERSCPELFSALSAGHVRTVALPAHPSAGPLVVDWRSSWGRPQVTRDCQSATGTGLEEVRAAVEQSPRSVAVHSPSYEAPGSWDALGLLGVLGWLAYLLAGPDPRHGTRWGWFWLGATLSVAVPLFVLVEPARLWARASPPRHRWLTGGRGLLLGLVASLAGRAALPDLTGVLWSTGGAP